MALFFLISTAWGTVRIGVVTDTRYDRADYAGRAAVALDIVNKFKTEEVNLVLHLGNVYEGNFSPDGTSQQKQEDYLADKTIYEPIWESIDAPVYWLVGNLDRFGIGNSFFVQNWASFILT